MHNLAHNIPVLNSPSFVYNQFGSYGTTYNQVCQVKMCIIIYFVLYMLHNRLDQWIDKVRNKQEFHNL